MNYFTLELVGLLVVLFVLSGVAWAGVRGGAPWVPTSRKGVEKALQLARLQAGETVYDVGCGDGRTMWAAHRAGAGRVVGIELALPLWGLCQLRRVLGRYANTEVRWGNAFAQGDYAEADVLFVFLMTEPMQEFERVVWPQLKTGTRVVSHAFTMPNVPVRETVPFVKWGHAPLYLYVK